MLNITCEHIVHRFCRSPPPPRVRKAFSGQQSSQQMGGARSASPARKPARRNVETPAVSAPERLQEAQSSFLKDRLPVIAETAAEVQHAQRGVMNQPGLSGLSEGGLRGLATVRSLSHILTHTSALSPQ